MLPPLLFLLAACASTTPPQNPATLKSVSNDQIILDEGLRWLQENPDDLEARILTGDAAWRLRDSTIAWDIWTYDATRILETDVYLGQLMIKVAVEWRLLDLAEEYIGIKPPESILPEMAKERELWLARVRSLKIEAFDAVQRGDKELLLGETARAFDFYQRASRAWPRPDHKARLVAMEALFESRRGKKGSKEAARTLLGSALSMDASAPVLWIELLICQNFGEPECERKTREQILKLYPDTPWANNAKR